MNVYSPDPPPEDWDALDREVNKQARKSTDDCPQTPLHGTTEDPAPGPTLPSLAEFEVLKELGRGGMGIVYLARQKDSGELVALKMLPEVAGLNSSLKERFFIEAEAGLRLKHPNIVAGRGLRRYGGVPYIVMEYVNGQTLAARLTQQPLPERQAADLTLALARAVAYAHGNDVVHRDLKPANVLLTLDGSPMICDFGLARLPDGPQQTTDGRILGTPQFMAPEQARGETTRISAAVDVYALGATLYEMLTGRPPYLAATQAGILIQVGNPLQEPARPRSLNPEVSLPMEAICLKCLEKEPANRYAGALELANDLTMYLNKNQVLAPLWTRARAVRKWARRHPLPTALSIVLLLVLVIGTTWLYWKYQDEAAARILAEQRLYVQTLQSADHLGVTEPDRAYELLQDLSLCPPELRSIDWALLAKRYSPSRSLVGHEGDVFGLAIAPDGKTMVTGGADHRVLLWDVRSGQVRQTLDTGTAAVTTVCFSPNGQRIASAGADGRISLWDAQTGKHCYDLPGQHTAAINSLAFSPDGLTLASGGNDRLIRIWNLEKRTLARELSGHAQPISTLSFAPDGKTLASGAGATKTPQLDVNHFGLGEVKCWTLATGAVHDVGGNFKGGVTAVAFSPTGIGRYLAIACASGPVVLLEAESLQTAAQFTHPFGSACLAFSPDGKFLAVGSEPDSTSKTGDRMATIRVYNMASRAQHCQLRGHPLRVHAIAFGPNVPSGLPLLASVGCNGSVQLRPSGSPERLDLLKQAKSISSVALSPDGQTLISGDDDGIARASDLSALDAPRELERRHNHKGAIRAVAIAPDGRLVATGGQDHKIRVWRLGLADEPLVLDHEEVVTSLAFLPDGQTLASAGDGHAVRLWDARTGQKLADLQGHFGPVSCLAVSPNGQMLASGGERDNAEGKTVGEVLLWDVPGRRYLRRITTPAEVESLSGLAFSPDGKTLASGHMLHGERTGAVCLWDVNGNQRISWKVGLGGVGAIAFAPDGRSLVTASSEDRELPSNLQVWSLSGEERLRLAGSDKRIRALSFATMYGRRLAAASRDGSVVIWEGAAGNRGD